MSLDLLHLKPDGPRLGLGYLGFGEYRRMLACDAAGIDLDAMKGFGGDRDWPSEATQPLVLLLAHSDCEGWLYQYECEVLRPVMLAFDPPLTWPSWMRDYHGSLAHLIVKCADEGGVIRFH